jgi:hypothetical protein
MKSRIMMFLNAHAQENVRAQKDREGRAGFHADFLRTQGTMHILQFLPFLFSLFPGLVQKICFLTLPPNGSDHISVN